jgi:glycosyltransferase involved in cell wall biosynthesis
MPKVILAANTDWYLYNFRLSLARFLREQGLEVVLVSPPGRYADNLRSSGFRWLPWELGRQTLAPWTEARALLQIEKIYRQEKPHLVHHFTIKPVLYGTLAARRLHIPAVVNSITGLGYVFLSQELKARLLRQVVTAAYRMAFRHPNNAAIFENEADRQVFLRLALLKPERSFVIEGVGVDAERFTPSAEPDGTPLVVLPARMLWDKGVGTLVEAARLLRSRLEARFALVGEPDPGNPANIEESYLHAWTKEGVVEWWGWQADMPGVFAKSSLVTLPSLGEGVPTVLLEAAASGRAIVATDVPGCREVVKPGLNGLLVPPQNAPALAEALYRLLSDPDLRGKMGAAGRQMILDKFTTARVNPATYDVYRRLMPF